MKKITFNSLFLNYNLLESLINVTFELEKGKCYLITGPLRAGKSSIFKILKGFIKGNRGSVRIDDDYFIPFTQNEMAYLAEKTYLYANLTVTEFIRYYLDLYENFDREKAVEILNELNIGLTRKLSNMSLEEKEILIFILTMCRKTELYLLDDPMSSTTPEERIKIINLVFDSLDHDKCIVLATDLLTDIRETFDTVIFMHEGHIISILDTKEMKQNSTMEIFDDYLHKKSSRRSRV